MGEVYPELWALDLDHSLLKTERAFGVFVETISAVAGEDRALFLLESRAKAKADGRTFNVLGNLVEQGIDDDGRQAIQAAFTERGKHEQLLYDDAEQFLSALDDRAWQGMIYTYGVEDWQTAKLAASGLLDRLPHLITDRKHKGEQIADWRQLNGLFVPAGVSGGLIVAETVVLSDDESTSFLGLPTDCLGYHLKRLDGEARPGSLAYATPPNAREVGKLMDIIPLHEARRTT